MFEFKGILASPLGNRLRAAIQSGNFRDLAGVYAPNAVLEAILPGRRRTVCGRQKIVAELSRWWRTPGQVVWWEEAEFSLGMVIRFERHSSAGERERPARQQHLIHTEGGIITKQVVLSDRPRLERIDRPTWPAGRERPEMLVSAVERAPLSHDGLSGNTLERFTMNDGRRFIVKHLSAESDWIMRATHDEGREALLWTSGVYERFPDEIQHSIVAVEREEGGWALVMRDVSDILLPPNVVLTRAETRRILRAARAMHANFQGEAIPGLCTLRDRYLLFSPATVERERFGVDLVPKVDQRCWELFDGLAPADVRETVYALVENPTPLTDQLEACGTTLIHGDLKPGNLGFSEGRVLAIDWSLACFAPPAVDFAWFLRYAFRMDPLRDELIEDFRSIYRGLHEERALHLALLGQMVMTGFRYCIDIIDSPDPRKRAECKAAFDWWVGRARQALEEWSPT